MCFQHTHQQKSALRVLNQWYKKMKKYALITIFILCTTTTSAHALTPYFSTGITNGIQNSGRYASTAYNTLWTLTAGVRYGLNDYIYMRNEFEYAKSDYTFKNSVSGIDYEYDTKTQIYMGNIIAEFRPRGFNSSIYAGVSAGTTNYETALKHPYSAPSKHHDVFTYGAMAGLSLNIISGLYVNLGLRYITTDEAKSDGNLVTTSSIHLGF